MKKLLIILIYLPFFASLCAQNPMDTPLIDISKGEGSPTLPPMYRPQLVDRNSDFERMKEAERLEQMYRQREMEIIKAMESQRRLQQAIQSNPNISTPKDISQPTINPHTNGKPISDLDLDLLERKESAQFAIKNTSLRRYDLPIDEAYKRSKDGKTLIPKKDGGIVKNSDSKKTSETKNNRIVLTILLVILTFFCVKKIKMK